jgi:tRNA threonylcarbamoyl adenosine modification protein YjeE
MKEYSSDHSMILNQDVHLDDISLIGKKIAQSLLSETKETFILWLSGDLGAGKTTMAGAILHGLGVSQLIPVLSPTFTYMTEYKCDQGTYAHMDLYRLVDGDEDSVEMLLADRFFRGILVEWPERVPHSKFIEKTHELQLNSSTKGALFRSLILTRGTI